MDGARSTQVGKAMGDRWDEAQKSGGTKRKKSEFHKGFAQLTGGGEASEGSHPESREKRKEGHLNFPLRLPLR